MENKFDPMTGELIQNNSNETTNNFDPMTGQPVNNGAPNNAQPPVKKAFPKWAMAVIAVAAVVLIVVLLAVGGVFRSNSAKVLLAVANTFSEQPMILEDLKLADITKWAEDEKVTTNVVMDGMGESMDISFAVNPSEVRAYGNLEGEYMPEIEFVIAYTKNDVKAQLPAICDEVFVYNYNEMPNGDLFEEIDEDDIEMINEALASYWTADNTKLEKRLTKALTKAFNEIEVEKIDSKDYKVDDKKRKCDGYSAVLTEDFFLDLLDEVEDIYEEECDEAVYELTEEAFDSLRDTFRDFPESEVEVYIYKNKLACVNLVMEDMDAEVELLFKGGEFRAQNMELTIDDGYDTYSIELEGKTDGKKEEYELSVDGMDVLVFEYDRKDGDFTIESDELEMDFEGNLVSERNAVTVSFEVEGVDMAVTISKGADFEKLSGEEFNIGEASQDEIMDLVEENEELMELMYELY